MARKKRDIAETEEAEQRLSHHGTGTKFAQHDKFGIFILGQRHKPQQYFPNRCVNRTGNMASLELKPRADIYHRRGLFRGHFFCKYPGIHGRIPLSHPLSFIFIASIVAGILPTMPIPSFFMTKLLLMNSLVMRIR